jgi:hypothetical protein
LQATFYGERDVVGTGNATTSAPFIHAVILLREASSRKNLCFIVRSHITSFNKEQN